MIWQKNLYFHFPEGNVSGIKTSLPIFEGNRKSSLSPLTWPASVELRKASGSGGNPSPLVFRFGEAQLCTSPNCASQSLRQRDENLKPLLFFFCKSESFEFYLAGCSQFLSFLFYGFFLYIFLFFHQQSLLSNFFLFFLLS